MRCFLVLMRRHIALMLHCAALARRRDLLRYDPGDPPSCQPGGMPAVTSCDHDHYVVGSAHHWDQSLEIILVNSGRPVAIAVMRNALESVHGHPRLLKDVRPHVG